MVKIKKATRDEGSGDVQQGRGRKTEGRKKLKADLNKKNGKEKSRGSPNFQSGK